MAGKIFISASTFAKCSEEPLNLLRQNNFSYYLNPLGRRLVQEEILKFGRDAQGVIAGVEPYDDYVLDNMPNLRCISRCGVGIDSISLEKAKDKGVVVRNTPGVVIQPVAELAVAMTFDLLKRLTVHTLILKSGRWQKIAGNLLSGKKIGILGLGRIGRRTAEIFKKLDIEVYGSDIFPDKEWAKNNDIKILDSGRLLEISDILILHLSFDEKNPFLLGEVEMSKMKKGAMVVNLSRGRFIDEEALYSALESSHLAGCALDVFSKEPYSGKLSELDNVVLTPHIATLTRESRLQMEMEASRNIIEVLSE